VSRLVKIDTNKLPYKNYLFAGFGLNLVLVGLIFLLKNNLPPEIPLYYGKPQGEDQLASTMALIIPPSLALVILILNSVVAYFSKEEFIKKILVISSLVVSAFAATTIIKIALLVGNF